MELKSDFIRNVQSTLLYRWFDKVWNKGDENAIDELMTDESQAHGIIADGQPGGAAGFKLFYNNFRSQFRNIHIAVDDVISQDDIESARTTVTAVHAQTGKAVTFSGICMVKVVDGKYEQ